VSGNPARDVNGDVLISSTSSNAIKESGNSTFSYSQIDVAPGGTCTLANCQVQSTFPTDPYASLEVPQPPAADVANFGCGTYDTTLKITSTTTLNPNNVPDCIYYLKNGMSIASGSTVNTNSNGALVYLAGSNTNTIFDSTGSATCHFVPIQDPNSPYRGISIFATRHLSDLSNNNLGGTVLNVAGTNGSSYEGTIYAPVETVNLSGTSGNDIQIGGIIAYSLTSTGTNTATVG
jgi:hypothetical protein